MLELLQYDFMRAALVASLCLALALSLLGVFVTLRGMAFLSDALAHISLTGYALGLLIGVHPSLAAIGFTVLVGLGIHPLERRLKLTTDTAIGALFATSLAVGVLLVTMLQDQGYRISLHGLLFGELLSVSWSDVALIGGVSGLAVAALLWLSVPLLQVSTSEDLARLHGVRVGFVQQAFIAIVAVVIGVAIQMVGALLVGALMIIPAAAAKVLARSFRQMFLLSGCFGVLSAVLGIWMSYELNWPPGPSLVVAAFGLLMVSGSVGVVRG